MKKIGALILLVSLFTITFASAVCNLDATLLNQDPDPAVPGEYVKLLFQVTGVENVECKDVFFEIPAQYPLVFDPGQTAKTQIKGGTHTVDYSSYLNIPFKVRIDENAIDGDNQIKVSFSESIASDAKSIVKNINLSIENPKVDFEVFVKNYNFQTKILTIQILNIGENDIEAVTLEIPDQDSIALEGTNINIVGDLDSQDYTTADFKAVPKNGKINLKISYTDNIDVRRSLEKTVSFSSKNFESTKANGNQTGVYVLIITLFIIAGIAYWYSRRRHIKKYHSK